jgi:hypothetical protein
LLLGWKRDAALVLVAVTSSVLFVLLLKLLVVRPRPPVEDARIIQGGFSFPRGHSAVSAVLYGTLADTSIDGPALWTSPTGSMRAIIAWTGTDASHHLNCLTSSNGLTFTNRHTLSETSPFRPAIAAVSTDANPTVELAWTGTDRAHHVNLLSGVPGQGYTKVSLPELSFTAPARSPPWL